MKNELRIIGGEWRSRKLRFPSAEGLRPTPNRVRETLFNWLRDDIEGATILDLYAGSGALGFEAASRGAAKVTQVEANTNVFAALEQNRELLKATVIKTVRADVLHYLSSQTKLAHDLVFLDPPFRHDLIVPTCLALETLGWLKPRAKMYFEAEHGAKLEGIPGNWQLLRKGTAGEVNYHLFQRTA